MNFDLNCLTLQAKPFLLLLINFFECDVSFIFYFIFWVDWGVSYGRKLNIVLGMHCMALQKWAYVIWVWPSQDGFVPTFFLFWTMGFIPLENMFASSASRC